MKKLILAAAVLAGLAWALWPAPRESFELGQRFTMGPAVAAAAPPPSGGGLIMTKTCDSLAAPGATVNCTFVVTNRNTASAVTDLLVQNTDPQGVTTIYPCLQGGVPVNDLSRRGAPGGTDTCTGSFTETAWTCDNTTLFRDHLEGFADDLNEGPVSGEAFWTVEIYTCTPTNTPINTATPTPTATPRPLPDLAPYTPSGWSDSIIVNSDCSSNTDSSPLLTTQTLCVNWAGKNVGVGATWNTFLVAWYIDGVPQVPFYSIAPPFNPGDTIQLGTIGNFSIGSLSAGSHSITLTMDVTGTQPESDETNNSYTKNFTVLAPTSTPTNTPTITPTRTFTPTGTITPPTSTPSVTNTPTKTPRIPVTVPFRTVTPFGTATNTPTGTITPPSATPTITATPGPSCSGTGGMAVSVSGLSLVPSFTRTVYTATATGGTTPYSYRWSCDFHKLAPVFLPGQQTTACSFPAPGRYIVEVLVQDKNNNRAYCGTAVTVYQ